jgi:outer membrane protein OmpA-like peptidoglycan-associated protein
MRGGLPPGSCARGCDIHSWCVVQLMIRVDKPGGSLAESFLGEDAMKRFHSVVKTALSCVAVTLLLSPGAGFAQERFPADSGLWDYHEAPNYRESESHPLRILGYVLHPIGWVAQEVIFRPLSYFAASSETSRKVMGYRDPFDFRKPSCFSADDSTPNCRDFPPFNTIGAGARVESTEAAINESEPARQVYLPDVNFDFNSHKLTDLGEGRVRQIAQLLNEAPGMRIVLEGNADQIGSDVYNEKLGMNRAESVRQRLVGLGVAPDRLSSVTFGKSKPVFAEQESWARAVNRRVSAQATGDSVATATR